MEIYNEHEDDYFAGACSIWRFSDFSSRAGNQGWDNKLEMAESLLKAMKERELDNYDSPKYEGDSDDYHAIAQHLLHPDSGFVPSNILTAVVTKSQRGYKHMVALQENGPFTSFTSSRSHSPDGDLTFFAVRVDDFLNWCLKNFKAKAPPAPPVPVPLVTRGPKGFTTKPTPAPKQISSVVKSPAAKRKHQSKPGV